MCTIAGYVGARSAAPILIEMMRREEGFDSGFYTGIATIHEGKLYYARLTGDLDHLLANTDAASLPGNIGIIHSRTKSGGGDMWSHPFIGERGGAPYLAYVANGSGGFFTPRRTVLNPIADQLLADGYKIRSKEAFPTGKYVTFSDGESAHSSDVYAQYIMRSMDRGMELAPAMEDALSTIPSEVVCLAIALSNPDAIGFTRINQPMMVAFSDHGAYMATSAMAMPEDAGDPSLLPPLSSGYVQQNGVTAFPYKNPPGKVAPIDAALTHKAFETVCAALRTKKQTIHSLYGMVLPLFGEIETAPTSPLIYEILRSLRNRGLLKSENIRVDGVFEGMTAPRTKFWLEG